MWIKQFPWCPLAIAHLYILDHLADSQITDIPPPTPQISKLTADYISDKLKLEWYDGGSDFQDETDVTWQIQILRKDPKEEVALETYKSTLTGNNKLIHWEWTSDLPFNCTTHYVRIRSRLAGGEEWSEWSEIQTIPGKQSGMYPVDRVVQEGSDVTFCCVWNEGETMTTLNYGGCNTSPCRTASLTGLSATIHVENVAVSPSSGFNAWCLAQKGSSSFDSSLYGTVLFVGYPPATPEKFDCDLLNSEEIKCKWERGRSTALFGPRGTHYFLTEGLSGKNITCPQARYRNVPSECSFPILADQTKYHFTLQAYNNLGSAKASVLFEIN